VAALAGINRGNKLATENAAVDYVRHARPTGMQKAERKPVLTSALIVLILVLVIIGPYVIAVHGVPQGFVFRGTLEPSGDESQYLAAVRMGINGAWLWHDPYMAHTPPAILMYPMYLLAGHTAGLVGLDVIGGFAFAHILAGFVLLSVLWRAGSLYFKSSRLAWFLAFSMLSGGLYWLVALLVAWNVSPVPLSHAGTPWLSGFTSVVMGAHEPLGVAGQIMAFIGLLRASTSRGWVTAAEIAYGAAGTAIIGLTFPVLLPLTFVVLGLFTLWLIVQARDDVARVQVIQRHLLLVLLIAIPGLLFSAYYYRVFSDGVWSAGKFTTVSGSPFVENVVIWGILLPVAAWGWRNAAPQYRPLATVLALWVCCALAGSQLPFWQGQRYVADLNICSGALFALGVLSKDRTMRVRRRWLVILGLGPIIQYLFLLTSLSGGNSAFLYSHKAEYDAIRWLGTQTRAGDVVFTPFGLGNIVPVASNMHVVAGHSFQTIDLAAALRQLNAFYGPRRFVIFDRWDAENGGFDPRTLPGLRAVFSEEDVTVYATTQAS
jgi:hypothetical protein